MTTATQYGFFVDTTKCTGCKTCHIACKDRSDLPVGIKWRRVYEYGGGNWQTNADGSFKQTVFTSYTSIGCNHCDNPACMNVCPVGAYNKDADTGLVQHDQEACIGCKLCAGENGCPYDAPQFDESRGVMTKCDGCIDRVKAGRKPSCVDSCPLRAIDFGPIDELRAKHGNNADNFVLPSASQTLPNLVVKANGKDQAGGEIANAFEV